MDYDVIIAGAGVTGSAIARELSKTDLKILVLEKAGDVCEGTSKANSGIVHAGFDAPSGTLKARLNVEGNRMIYELAKDLNIDVINNGSLVLCFDENRRPALQELLERGIRNGVKGLQILEKEEVLAREPNINPEVVCALWAPTGGIVCPFSLNFALAENAADNGVEFLFNTPVTSIQWDKGKWLVNERFACRVFVNAAGLNADQIHNMAIHEQPVHIQPRKGEYFLFDHAAASRCRSTLFQLPGALGKGTLITPTVHGNLLAGPTAENIEDKEDTATTQAGLDKIRQSAARIMPDLPWNQVITSFAGSRAVGETGDFIIQESRNGFIDAAAIESPGLTSSPAIGVMVADMIREKLKPGQNPHFISERRGFVHLDASDPARWQALIQQDPDYGSVICRCETITKAQIKDACTRSIPARSLDGVKRRVRPGAGRCQGGFCSPKVLEILSEVHQIPPEQVLKSVDGSQLLTGPLKERTELSGN